MKKCYTLLILLLALKINFAQNSNAFETITIGLDAALTVYESTFKDFWNSGNAFGFSASTPFYYGNLDVGLIFNPFYAKDKAQPDFTGLLLSLQWSESVFNYNNTNLSLGVSAGLFQMIFDKTNEYYNQSDLFEHEIALGLSALLTQKIENNLSVNLSIQHHTIHFRKKLSFVYLGASLRYSFDTPGWIKSFLK